MTDRLAGVHPRLILAVGQIVIRMGKLGLPMLVVSGVRTREEQAALYAQGRTLPGLIVTQASGLAREAGGTGVSNHQVHADGFGHAVDMAFFVRGAPSWGDTLPWPIYGATAISLGLEWGGRWRRPDRPHIELP